MALGFSSTQAAAVLNAYFNATNLTAPTAIWMQLHTADPGAAGTTAVAGNTTRKDVTAVFSAASGGTVTNDVAVTWTSVSTSEDYTHYSIHSASSAGTFYWSGSITANPVTAGDTFTLAIGDIDATLSTAA
jgi:hypothetical protein